MMINEVAQLAGISVRTLHHYDDIGLLKPTSTTESGYRIYSSDNLDLLQQILFFKKLGLPLKKIKNILDNPQYNRQETLETQYQMLVEEQQRLNNMIQLIEKTIHYSKGELTMSNEEKFKGFDFTSNNYEQEAKEKWDNEAVEQTKKKLNPFNQQRFNEIYRHLATLRHLSPDHRDAQQGIEEWFNYLNTIGNYSTEAFAALGQIYIDDERFTKNIDQFGEGLAKFMRDAMIIFSKKA